MKKYFLSASLLLAVAFQAISQDDVWVDKFKQLGNELATPNNQRTASGAPGKEYWQQQADYVMNIKLDDDNQRVYGDEVITYTNNSPDALYYLWVQLDQNVRSKESDSHKIEQNTIQDRVSINDLIDLEPWFDGGFKLDYVQDAQGKNLKFTVNKTMMRIDLTSPLKPGSSFTFKIKWWYNINDRMRIGGRSGYEYFEKDNNYLYTIAQYYPRMVVYTDYAGWQHKQFLGAGEFTLDFGNYDVKITVPSDHIVAATGVLQNPKDVLTSDQMKRFDQAKSSDKPVIICTQTEAEEREKGKSKALKTWHFKAQNVRDFAFASSRKFIWDAQAVDINGKKPLAMSFYPKEGNPLWEQYSTRAVAHTLRIYSQHTIDYPYPVAISVHAKWIGMEYPMICFNGGRPEEDGTYSENTKYSMLSVIIHEVGHNFFPMIINSDERQWTWMDEGLNTFCEYLAEKEWDQEYPTRRGPARNIVDYMKGDKSHISPIMTNSESIFQFGNNAYGKPATALNILRETIMGRELFDYAFKEYARRWAFKHPTPEDFFRTMEDASGVDLDWFWRGWFYGTEHCDMSLKSVKLFQLDTQNPMVENELRKNEANAQPEDISLMRDKKEGIVTVVEKDPFARDFYNSYDEYAVTPFDVNAYEEYVKTLSDEEKAELEAGKFYYQLTVENVGGLIMPVIFEFEFADGEKKIVYIPAEIWKKSPKEVNKVFAFTKEVVSISLDPFLETADVELNNNYWPARVVPTKFELYKQGQRGRSESNPMQRARSSK
ncbi:MAG: M1 family metallopeptidase [Flavobacteriales bacterium]